MDLTLIGLNHRTAPVDIRERIAFTGSRLEEALDQLRRDYGVQEGMIVSTCNRVEILVGGPGRQESVERVKEFLYAYHSLHAPLLEDHLYVYRGAEMIRHVFRVAASLDSMVVGEAQILGQIKEAFARARRSGSAGAGLNSLIPRAFYVAKRVRTETRISNAAVSVSSAAVELARKVFGDLSGKSVLLLGAGKMSELAARNLLHSGISRFLIANRNPEKSQELAERFNGTAVLFSEMNRYLEHSDIVLVSTGSDGFVLERDTLESVIRDRKYSPLFIIDISVPRNVDPAVNQIGNIFLYDIDDLESVISSNLEERRREAELAEEIVNEEVQNFLHRLATHGAGRLAGSLREKIEGICREELEKHRRHLSPEDFDRMEEILRRAARRIAHPLLIEMQRSEPPEAPRQPGREILRKAFRLDEES